MTSSSTRLRAATSQLRAEARVARIARDRYLPFRVIDEPPLDAPDEEWLVWADAMQQIGDPRGELIALEPHPARHAAHVKQHADALFGRTVGRYVRKGDMRVTWRRARVDIVEVRIDEHANGAQMFADLIGSPIAPQMRGLAIAAVAPAESRGRNLPALDLTTPIGWFREMEIPRNWTSLALIDDRARAAEYMITRDFQPEPNLVDLGPLATLWPSVAHLEELRIVVADTTPLQLGTIRLPELRAFTLHSLYWAEGLGALLANAQWPKLASLELRLVDDFTINDPDDAKAYMRVYGRDDNGRDDVAFSRPRERLDWRGELEPLAASLEKLPLERLALTSAHDVDIVLEMLESHAMPHLRELDLSDGAFDTKDAERLANNPLVLQLRRLVLERVAAPSAKALAGLAAEVVHSCAPNRPTYRYVVGWE